MLSYRNRSLLGISLFLVIPLLALVPLIQGCGLSDGLQKLPDAPQINAPSTDVGVTRELKFDLSEGNGALTSIVAPTTLKPMANFVTTARQSKITVKLNLRARSQAELDAHEAEIRHIRKKNASVAYGHSSAGCNVKQSAAGQIAAIEGSCLESATFILPEHELKRTYLGLNPLFSGPIAVGDLKVVLGNHPDRPEALQLIRTYLAYLRSDAKPLTVNDLSMIMGDVPPSVQSDTSYLLAKRVSDPENAEDLDSDAFANKGDWEKVVGEIRKPKDQLPDEL